MGQEGVNVNEALKAAVQFHQAGRLNEAQALYRQVLQTDPNQPDANHFLGVIAYQSGHLEAAAELIGRAIAANPGMAAAHVNLGNVLADQEKPELAIEAYQRALALQPHAPAIHNNLATAFRAQGKLTEARAGFERAVQLKPDYVDAIVNLAGLQRLEGSLADALEGIERALALRPTDWTLFLTKGNLLKDLARNEEAADCYRLALQGRPESAEILSNLGMVLGRLDRLEEAERSFIQALTFNPGYAEAHLSFGCLWWQRGNVTEAEKRFQRALELAPDLAEGHALYGSLLQDLARHEESVAHFQRAMLLKPDYWQGMSSYLFGINYLPDADLATLFEAYQEFGRRYEDPLAKEVRPHLNVVDPDRRLRVGYVSPDFRGHACAIFTEPLLAAHDRGQVEIWCYAQDQKSDEVTDRIKRLADHWVSTVGVSDAELARRIHADRIDVLVDLAGQSGNNRLLAFARKPAPVQITWLGMGYTTGLSNMDYFLTDHYFVPPEVERYFTETVYRLPRAAYTYRPPANCVEVRPLPALERGYVTFGCYSRTVRLNHRVVALWSRILKEVPHSRLALNDKTLKDPQIQELYRCRFAENGIEKDRIIFTLTMGTQQTMAAYGEIDIALDPFPHNAGTATFESLWMGVPVVSLADRPPLGRFGASILGHVGLSEWVAETPEAYVQIAVRASRDLAGLSALRQGLRARMDASVFRDEQGFARDMEAAYRDMWRRWCLRADGSGE